MANRVKQANEVSVAPTNGEPKPGIGADEAKEAIDRDRKERIARTEASLKEIFARDKTGLFPIAVLRPHMNPPVEIHIEILATS